MSNLRGGVGKSSIAFNLAYEISRLSSVLLSDLCPQCNFTEMLIGEFRPKVNIYDALKPMILGAAFGEEPVDLSYRVSQYCNDFKGGKGAYLLLHRLQFFVPPASPAVYTSS